MMFRVTYAQFLDFERRFFNKEFPNLRYGQAFMNSFDMHGDSDLWNMQTAATARFRIINLYVQE